MSSATTGLSSRKTYNTTGYKPASEMIEITSYLPYFYKTYTMNYGDKFFTAAILRYTIVKNESDDSTTRCGACCEKKLITMYHIEVTRGQQTWIIQRRYSEFLQLLRISKSNFKRFPPKTYGLTSWLPSKGQFIHDRMVRLNEFLGYYLDKESKADRIRGNILVMEFLGFIPSTVYHFGN